MQLRTVTRASAAMATLCVAGASILTFAPSASAFEQERTVVNEEEIFTVEYSPIAASNPSGEAHTPETCATSAYCDVVPVTVNAPAGITEEDEYFIEFELDWESERAPGDPVFAPSGAALNDVDFYVYTDPPTAEEAESRGAAPNSESDPYITSGGSLEAPEVAFLFKPAGDYLLVINNYLGANTGYQITYSWFNETLPSPFESLAPEFVPQTTTTTTTITTTTTTVPTTIASGPTTAPPATLAPVVAQVDTDFDAGAFDTSDFDDELAAPIPINATPVVETFEPPSGLALFLWMAALPFGIVALGGATLMRRRATL